MITRGQNFQEIPLNIVGSSTFGRYPKISIEKTYNMFMSDNFMVTYGGYHSVISGLGTAGRAIHASTKLNKMVAVINENVYLVETFYNHNTAQSEGSILTKIGTLQTSIGDVFIAENNKPQILISDNSALYVYDTSLIPLADCYVATTANLTATYSNGSAGVNATLTNAGAQSAFTVDGVSPPINSRILVKDQNANATFQNGVYTLTTVGTGSTNWILTRATDYNDSDLIVPRVTVKVTNGTANSGKTWVQSKHVLTVGTDPIVFVARGDWSFFQPVPGLSFTPGYIEFHDTYFLCAARDDTFYNPPADNTWRLSAQNDGTLWLNDAASIGLLQSKPDNTQAIIRFPSRGNLIFVMGQVVTEAWIDQGLQLFPYTRSTSFNIDYGCANPNTIASMDELVVWLGQNEKSGPVIMYSTGGMPKRITTDGIDYVLSNLQTPSDAEAFMYRQDGHIFYHINFYSDNLSLFYDFNTDKFYHACDENLNYFIAKEVAFFNDQYYFVAKDSGDIFAFDTQITTYNGKTIPRIRVPKNIRLPTQDYFIGNDAGFTIEQGETPYQMQVGAQINLMTEDNKFLITDGSLIFLQTQDGNYLTDQNDNLLISEQLNTVDFFFLVEELNEIFNSVPRIDMSVSYDGGYSFSSDMPNYLNPIGQRQNKLMWWQLGAANDMVLQFKFWGIGRFVATDGIVNIRQ
jgi:hypothetical protein